MAASVVLLSDLNHVAVLTGDTERFLEFYAGVFDATHEVLQERDRFKLTVVWIGPTSERLRSPVLGRLTSRRTRPTKRSSIEDLASRVQHSGVLDRRR